MLLKGCYVAVVTPFAADGSVDEKGLRSNIDFLLERGVAGIIPCGTTGESATLSWKEHNYVVETAVSHVKGRAQVIAGAGSNNTAESLTAARFAKEIGADAILSITPYYNKPTQEGLFLHYQALASRVDIPIVLYNVPGRTGVNLLPDTVERLCAFQNIVAIKEASGDLVQISDIHRRCGQRLTILSGDDALTLPMLLLGATGVISVAANIVPERVKAMIDAFTLKNLSEATAMHEQLLPLFRTLFIETSPSPIKSAMNYLGFAAGPLRLPLAPMSEMNREKLITLIDSYKIKF
ncbi:MAG TPA: 4-hydroxy-tetrahydrodipicolinate synthase [Chitinivibrionales bacterium]